MAKSYFAGVGKLVSGIFKGSDNDRMYGNSKIKEVGPFLRTLCYCQYLVSKRN